MARKVSNPKTLPKKDSNVKAESNGSVRPTSKEKQEVKPTPTIPVPVQQPKPQSLVEMQQSIQVEIEMFLDRLRSRGWGISIVEKVVDGKVESQGLEARPLKVT